MVIKCVQVMYVSESGQCSFDLESCGTGCQKGYGFCLLKSEINKDSCLDCEDCFNCEDSPIDRLLCQNTCFKEGNKKNEIIEIEPCNELDNETRIKTHINPEKLCSECNKCIDCTQYSDIANSYPNACKLISNNISTDGTCGPQYDNKVCPNNQCCDNSGHCNVTKDSCGKNCQYGYGNCLTKDNRYCPDCEECNVCETEFDSFICPYTCMTNQFKINIIKEGHKFDKYYNKYDCPKINKLCYEKGNYGGFGFYILN